MKRTYYTIWVDILILFRSGPNKNWKYYALLLISLGMSFNLATIMTIIQLSFGYYFYDLDFIPDFPFSGVLKFVVLFLLPPTIINYFLVFRGRRYESFLKKYNYHNGKFFLLYLLISFTLPFVLGLLGGLLRT
jgi:hypothetical protein